METLEDLDIVVIGGGVIGMSVARELAARGREVVLVEAETAFGTHTSSRNSEVIHAGIYYPSGSLKATTCVRGKGLLYEYCEAHEVAHQRIGKLIVATSEAQRDELQKLEQQARSNGVLDLEWLDAKQIHELEPEVIAECGLFSPSTGIIDSHEYLHQLRRDAETAGATLVLSSRVIDGRVTDRGFELSLGGAESMRLNCSALVNAAGLTAQAVARSISGIPAETIPPSHLAKGHYFTLSGRSPFRHLVYPVPEPGGLGIHVTLDLAGSARFGPDVVWTETLDYAFEPQREAAFERAIRAYYPALAAGSLVQGYTGLRPKIVPRGAPAADFVVQGPEVTGLPLVNLYGIESPGLTASLALAEVVASTLTSAGRHPYSNLGNSS